MGTGVATTVPRGQLLAQCWAELGPAVAPLSNGLGRPLARTEKLILDPLVLRPAHNPRFASGSIRAEHVEELRAMIVAAGPKLAATAAWFTLLKKARRRAKVTEGNPQDLYFQRCFELAAEYGGPGARPDAERIAADTVAEIHEPGERLTVTELRDFVRTHAPELTELLTRTWPAPWERTAPAARLADFLAADIPDTALFAALITGRAGTHEWAAVERPGVALGYGLTDYERLVPPALGSTASKKRLPKPMDRSILERLFAAFTSAFHRESMAAVPALVRQEIHRCAQPWQLAEEVSRVVLVLGRDATDGLDGNGPAAPGAATKLRARWQREAYVRRVQRLPWAEVPERSRADVYGVRQAYLRRLWVRLHGRELRSELVTAEQVWDLLDGVLRSVIMDQRDQLRSALTREAGAA
ncbi:hypothetical protein [Actinocrispum wychmicini]|uniref:Uncharacterized protein n=1 Tax=Actinocrispum wychmicini TaxID=1213861 RepID=A0A4R2JR52_9PSEU|nr:hypothetical protein [Actinocrispum wychmicini]TCO59688.1 hypothetical protein EV192_104531 [Actinocrispum wychmicini]